jgi:hypothetical protein
MQAINTITSRKPSIIQIIGERVELRKTGREYIGLCQFHRDRNPSMSVNEEKGVFYCHSCGATGDVIDYIMRLDGLSFRQALASLGIDHTDVVPRPNNDPLKQAAAQISQWADTQTDRANSLLREIGHRLQLAKQAGWREEEKISSREWAILSDLADDLQTVKLVIELYENRARIEALLADADDHEYQPEKFPPLTEAYRTYLRERLPSKVDL